MNLMPYRRVVVAEHERALYFVDRALEQVLEPGVHRVFDPLGRVRVEVYDIGEPEFVHPHTDVYFEQHADLMGTYFERLVVASGEVGLVFVDGMLVGVHAPGSRAYYWKGARKLEMQRFDVSETVHVPKVLARHVTRPASLAVKRRLEDVVKLAEVPAEHVGLLYVDGVFSESLNPGVHAFWGVAAKLNVSFVELRLLAMEVQGQEILSKDKVSLRINLSASYKVIDPVKAESSVKSYVEFLYRELQFALRRAVGTRTLDALLGDKSTLEREVYEPVRERASAHGLEVVSVGVKDIVLPGDMKTILNQVVEAEKVAQANVIRRREETSATRSLLNTAKLMDENPTLMRLKELEALEKVADKVDRLTVFGGLDGVLNDTVRLGLDAR